MRPETIKFLEENICSKFLDVSLGDDFKKDTKSKSNRTSGNKRALHNKVKRQHIEWEKYLEVIYLIRGQYWKYMEKLFV